MGCGCNNKRVGSSMIRPGASTFEPDEWGPIIWRYIHALTERLGNASNQAQNIEQAMLYTKVITNLYTIVPCTVCQRHAKEYLDANPFPSLDGLNGEALRSAGRTWLFNFHTAVRLRKEQPIIVATVDECRALFQGATISNGEYSKIVQIIAGAVRNHWVKLEYWRKWYNYSEQLRIQLRDVVV